MSKIAEISKGAKLLASAKRLPAVKESNGAIEFVVGITPSDCAPIYVSGSSRLGNSGDMVEARAHLDALEKGEGEREWGTIGAAGTEIQWSSETEARRMAEEQDTIRAQAEALAPAGSVLGTQDLDIKFAKKCWRDYKRRKKNEQAD